MPIPFLGHLWREDLIPLSLFSTAIRTLPWLVLVGLLKFWFSGASNKSERLMRSKQIIMTGGTSGIGASLARSLAQRGASLILLTSQPPSDPFLVDYIDDLRATTDNEFIYAEQVDLSSLHSIRLFATRWVDNAPPRRLDMVILCAATLTPYFSSKAKTSKSTENSSLPTATMTSDGLEPCWGVNYLANFHLLSILSPALRAQPADRDVRVIMATCQAYRAGNMKGMKDSKSPLPAGAEYSTSKLALMTFASAFQKHLASFKRLDKQPSNARVILVDPGAARTPGLRRWLSLGSVPGLLAYLLLWPLWWLFLKSADAGAESFLTAVMEAKLSAGIAGGEGVGSDSKLEGAGEATAIRNSNAELAFLRECRAARILRPEVGDEKVERELWEFSEKQITALEKEGAVRRALAKKEAERLEKEAKAKGKTKAGETEKTEEVKGKGEDVRQVETATGKEARTPGSRRSRNT